MFIIRAFFFLVLSVSISSCDRSIETRNKLAEAKNKVTIAQEIAELDGFNRFNDTDLMNKQRGEMEQKQLELQRQSHVIRGMQDGSLMQKYSEKGLNEESPY